MTDRLSIATLTWARDQEEEALLRTSIEALAGFDRPVYVCDGGSPKAFLSFLRRFKNVTLVPSAEKGLWNQAFASLSAAAQSGSAFVLYTEPDKLDFFRDHLETFLTKADLNESTGVVLAERNQSAFATFPEFQQKTETTINVACREVIGLDLDYTYGPFILNSKLVNYTNPLPADIGWGWRPFVFGIASRLKLDVVSRPGEYNCPVDQRTDSETERRYRLRQLAQNIEGILLSTSINLNT